MFLSRGLKSPTWMKKDDFTGQDVILYSFQGFPTDKRFSTSYSDYRNTYTIVIEDVRLSDAGTYVCQFFDGNQEHRREIYLTVLGEQNGHFIFSLQPLKIIISCFL